MKRLLTVLFIAVALLVADTVMAQDGGRKKKDKKKKENTEMKDSTSAGSPADISIDEPGTEKAPKVESKTADSTATAPGGPISVPGGLERPKEEETPSPAPKDESKESEAGGSGAKKADEVEDLGEGEETPAGAGSLHGSGGSGITIDEAGTEKLKKPADAVSGGVNPTNLTIDEAGTEKKKEVKAPANLDDTKTSTDSSSTSGSATPAPTVKEQVKEEVKEEVKDAAKDKAKEEGKEAGRKVLDKIVPKNN